MPRFVNEITILAHTRIHIIYIRIRMKPTLHSTVINHENSEFAVGNLKFNITTNTLTN